MSEDSRREGRPQPAGWHEREGAPETPKQRHFHRYATLLHIPPAAAIQTASRQAREVLPLAEGAGDSGRENPYRRKPGTEDRRHAGLFGCRGPARSRFLLPYRRTHRPRRLRSPAQPVGGHRRGRGEDLAGLPGHSRNRREARADSLRQLRNDFSEADEGMSRQPTE